MNTYFYHFLIFLFADDLDDDYLPEWDEDEIIQPKKKGRPAKSAIKGKNLVYFITSYSSKLEV